MSELFRRRMRTHAWFLATLVLLAVAVGAIATIAAQASPKQWATVGGDLGNTRYSTLGQITAQNVTKVGVAWTSQKLEPVPTSRAQPVVVDGLMFFTAPPFVYR